MILALGGVMVAAALLAVAAHHADSHSQTVLVAASLARPPMLLSIPGTVLVTLASGVPGLLVGAASIVLAASTQLPLLRNRFRKHTPTGNPFAVLHANILLGRADPDAVVALVDEHRPDVLTVVELTREAHQRLIDAGVLDRLPHSFVSPARGGNGTGIYSRHPVVDETRHDGYVTELLSARIAVPEGPQPLVFAVHPVPPWPRHPEAWVRELAAIRQLLAKIPVADGPVVVAGDFNATFDHKRYRKLLSDGYTDAAMDVGAGHIATYHASMRIPPLISIDHVLIRGAHAVDVAPVDLPGSDHRGLRASLVLG